MQNTNASTGLREVEERARGIRKRIQSHGEPPFGDSDWLFQKILKPEEKLELGTRIATKAQLSSIVEMRAQEGMNKFLDVLFGIVFPILRFPNRA